MGTGWRKAFCSTIQRNRDFTTDMVKLQPEEQDDQQKLKFLQKFGFLSSGSSNPSTPRFNSNGPKLSCKTNVCTTVQQPTSNVSSKLHCNTSTSSSTANTTPKSCIKDSRKHYGSNPSSPRTPLSILKTTLRRSKSSCGVCTQSAKTNQRMAIFTGECSHTFHFPCIAEYTKKHTTLICPVCQSTWKDVPLLTNHKLHYQNQLIQPHEKQEQEIPINQKTPSQNLSPRNVNQEELPAIAKNGDSETYNDDETLVSPEFVPILYGNGNPEAEADEDVHEFQGFFVNSIPSDVASRYTLNESRNIEVSLLPEAAVVAVGQTRETIALVLKVKAPSAHSSHTAQLNETAGRAPVDLVSVLDLSGSMSGSKLQMLKRAMGLVISSLGSADRLSIVSFSATVKRLLPLTRMNAHGQKTARRIIDRLGCSQGTSVSEALKIASKILQDRRERNPVATVILLSDDPDDMLQTKDDDRQRQRGYNESTTRFSHVEIPVRSSGFGRKFGFTNEPHEDAFSKCVGGLLSVVLHDLRIQITVGLGSDPAEIAAIYSCNVQPALLGLGSIRVGDLYAEEEREFLIELKVPVSGYKSHHVLSVKCSFKHPTTKEQFTNLGINLLVPRPQDGPSTLPRSEWLRNLFVFTRALAESRRLIELNELTFTAHLLSSALDLVMQSKCGSAKEFIKGLELKLAEVQWRQQMMLQRNHEAAGLLIDKYGEPLTPISARRAAVKLAKPVLRRSMSQISDLHGFENARF